MENEFLRRGQKKSQELLKKLKIENEKLLEVQDNVFEDFENIKSEISEENNEGVNELNTNFRHSPTSLTVRVYWRHVRDDWEA